MKSKLREKILASPDKVYYTNVFQYFIDPNGFICRCRRAALDTPDCVVEFVPDWFFA